MRPTRALHVIFEWWSGICGRRSAFPYYKINWVWFLTDQRNHILECRFPEIRNPRALGEQIENIPGVVGHGLFVGYAHAAIVAQGDGVWILRRGQAPALFTGSAPPAES